MARVILVGLLLVVAAPTALLAFHNPQRFLNETQPFCLTKNGMTFDQCKVRIDAGCPLFWYERGCDGFADGGCQPIHYCGFHCRSRCLDFRSRGCRWEDRLNECFNIWETKLPTSMPSRRPTPPTLATFSPTTPTLLSQAPTTTPPGIFSTSSPTISPSSTASPSMVITPSPFTSVPSISTSEVNSTTSASPTSSSTATSNPSMAPQTSPSLAPTYSILSESPSSAPSPPTFTPTSSPINTTITGQQQQLPQLCTTDMDCPDRMVCFNPNRTTWLAGFSGICGCARTLSKEGANCDIVSGSLGIDLSILAILLLVSFSLTVLTFAEMLLSRSSFKKGTALTHLTLFSWLANLFMVIWMALSISCDVEDSTFLVMSESKVCTLQVFILISGSVSIGSAMLMLLNLVAVWLTVVYPSHTPLAEISSKSSYGILPIVLFMVCAVINLSFAYWASLPILFINIVCCYICYSRAGSALDDFEAKNDVSALAVSATKAATSDEAAKVKLLKHTHHNTLKDTVWVTKRVYWFLLLAGLAGIVCFASLTRAYSWSYEESVWNRPSHWCFRTMQIAFVACFVVIFLDLRTFLSAARSEREENNKVVIFEV